MTERTDLSEQRHPGYTIVRIIAIVVLLLTLAAIVFAYSQAILYWNDINV